MKLNKKGFTLVELLAVIVILLIISVIAIPSISAAIERNKAKKDAAQIDVIESYAELYYENNKNSFNKANFCVNVSKLNLTDAEAKNSDGKRFTGSVIYKNNEFVYQNSTCTE